MEWDIGGEVFEWRGPAPYYFLAVPEREGADLKAAALAASYGWGMLPIQARIGSVEWTTSLWPKDGGYLLPLKDAVRKPLKLARGDAVEVRLTFDARPRPKKAPLQGCTFLVRRARGSRSPLSS